MASYNEIDGIPSHANNWLLNGVLRREWGYRGAVVSDYYGIRELVTRHISTPTSRMPPSARSSPASTSKLPIPRAMCICRSWCARAGFRWRWSTRPCGGCSRSSSKRDCSRTPTLIRRPRTPGPPRPTPIALAREAADHAIVLLKNDKGLLPLDASTIHRLAVVGTHAKDTPIGGYSDVPRHVVSVLEGHSGSGPRQVRGRLSAKACG